MGRVTDEALRVVADGGILEEFAAEAVMDDMMTGETTPAQMGALLMGLRMRGETAPELAGFARSMRRHAAAVDVSRRPVLDTCGTGGDGSHSFNISTVAALVAAGAGATVVKHGNRAATSTSGSADVLEALGVSLDPGPKVLAAMVEEAGFAFLYAQSVHRAMRFAAPVRREMGIRTVFNLLGPLTNPARPERQLLGVYDARYLPLMAEALQRLGVDHAIVVHGDGLDEVTLAGVTQYVRVDGDHLEWGQLTAADLDLPPYPQDAIVGGNPAANAEICRRVLAGDHGPHRDVVLANAGMALWAARLADAPASGVALARTSIDSGRAASVLKRLCQLSVETPS